MDTSTTLTTADLPRSFRFEPGDTPRRPTTSAEDLAPEPGRWCCEECSLAQFLDVLAA